MPGGCGLSAIPWEAISHSNWQENLVHPFPSLRGVVAVCPNIQPATCVRALQRPSNWIYHQYFLKSLKAKLRKKSHLYPGQWNLSRLSGIRTMWEFDEVYTAPDGGIEMPQTITKKLPREWAGLNHHSDPHHHGPR